MADYKYQAVDGAGNKVQGALAADTPRQLRQLLRDRGLTPLKVMADAPPKQATLRAWLPGAALGSTALALLTRQLATLVQAGLPLEEALGAVSAQSGPGRVRDLMQAVRTRVTEGYGLAVALSEFSYAFPALFRATVAAGEKSGHLSAVLEQLADYTEARQAAQRRIQLALLYPAILCVASVSIVGFLLGFVVPDVVRVFIDSGQALPLLTRGLIAGSALLRDYGLLLLLAAALVLLLARIALARPALRLRWHQCLLRIPLLQRMLRATDCAAFISTLAILGRSGVPLVDALAIASEVVANLAIRARLALAVRSVREGGSLTRALERCGDFPPMMLYMIASGERSGELDSMLARAARQQEQTLSASVALLLGLFEPLMLIVMGGAVLLIVLAILLPILNLNQLIT